MSSKEFARRVVSLAALATAGQIALLVYLPGIPSLEAEFGASGLGPWTFATFLIGFAIGQVVLGPLSDRWGRRPVALAGVIGIAITSLLCALATNPAALMSSRLLQGMAGASGLIVARAGARDLFEGPELVRAFGAITLLMAVVPGLAPFVGALLLEQYGWRAGFWATAAYSVLLIGPASALPPPPAGTAGPPRSILAPFQQVFSTPKFAVQMLGLSAFSGSLYAWFAGSANFLLIGVKMSASGFAGVQLLASLAYAVGALVPTVWAHRWRRDALVRWGCASAFAGTSALLALVVAVVVSPAPIVASVMVFGAGLGLVQAAGTAQVLAPFPKLAGAASSVIGATQILLGAIMAGLAGLAGTFAMAACMALCAGFGWFALSRRDSVADN